MDTFLYAINAILPIILLIILGYLLKKIKMFSPEFLSVANKVCFKVLLPVLLFQNIYAIDNLSNINWGYILYGSISIFVIFGLGLIAVIFLEKDNTKRGVILQCVFRSNFAIIGIPLAVLLFGEAGGAEASLISAFTIPIYNILAVISLSIFKPGLSAENLQGNSAASKYSVKSVFKGIVTNPLIIGIFTGLLVIAVRQLFVAVNVSFRLYDLKFVKDSIDYVARTATPVALLVLGGQFEFNAVKRLARPILIGTLARCLVVPALALAGACLIVPNLTGAHYASYIALYCTPVAVSSAIMAKEMKNDAELAGQLVVFTTVFSSVSIFVAIVIFRSLDLLA